MPARYAIGIDLGTSNTALAYADLNAADPGASLRVFEVPQLVGAGEIAGRPLLPSHLYLPGEHELSSDALTVPWPSRDDEKSPPAAVGLFARDLGAKVSARHIGSAKSWLCHPRVDRTAAILPWGAPAGVPRISPVEASSRILAHLRDSWDANHPTAPLAEQELVITVPASFDEAARALTLEAAARAGLPKPALLEEPQAAFYDWTRRHREDLAGALGESRLLLIVDVGGGTTDLTLIEAQPPKEEGGSPVLRRLAVGDHLLLGGDNMDIALAHLAEPRLSAKLSAAQWLLLVQSCRAAKELLLRPDAPERASVIVPGSGSRLIGGALTAELTRDEVRKLLLDGFFPLVSLSEEPARSRQAGLAELGLPYAQDAAITKHLASFLRRHSRTVAQARADWDPEKVAMPNIGTATDLVDGPPHFAPVDAVLYNGGALAPKLLADRVSAAISAWRAPGSKKLVLLHNDAPDLAVARGAATYALVRRGLGLRIGGGSPRSYYLALGEGEQAVCAVPRGAPEGSWIEIPNRTFMLVLGQPVRFRLLAASGYRPEQAGDLITLDEKTREEVHELPPLQAVVPGEGRAAVSLRAQLTELGTLEIYCAASQDRRWQLEFQLRGQPESGVDELGSAVSLPRAIEPARESLQFVFGKKPAPMQGREVKDLWRGLEKSLGERAKWSLAVNRDLFGTLWAGAQKRRRSADHERVFLSMAGFFLRPGFGAPLDGWRTNQIWTLFSQGLTHHKEAKVWAAWWVLWRRVAAGLPEEAHRILFDAVAPHLQPAPKGRVINPGKKPPGLAVDEMVRLLGALERLAPSQKELASSWLLERLSAGNAPGVVWALGRLGARVPVAGAAENVLAPEVASVLLEKLLALDWKKHEEAPFAAAQLARLSGDRARDLDSELREQTAKRLEQSGAAEWARGLREVIALDEKDEQRVFGEALPLGLHLA